MQVVEAGLLQQCSAGHCSLPCAESQGQAPARSSRQRLLSAGLFFHFEGNPHLVTVLTSLLPFRLAQMEDFEDFHLMVLWYRFPHRIQSPIFCSSGKITAQPCVASRGAHLHRSMAPFSTLRLRVRHLPLTLTSSLSCPLWSQ